MFVPVELLVPGTAGALLVVFAGPLDVELPFATPVLFATGWPALDEVEFPEGGEPGAAEGVVVCEGAWKPVVLERFLRLSWIALEAPEPLAGELVALIGLLLELSLP